MNIELKKLTITNFKGIKRLEIEFAKITNIFGRNESGKSSTFDAFTWLLFGKDCNDRSDFDIKPLNNDGKSADQTENEVEAMLVVDGQNISLRRVLREKWEKPKGALVAEFKGNETLFYYNDIPLKQADYKAKIESILNESVFKLITNPLYFSDRMNWKDRRQVLLKIAGTIDKSKILDSIATMQNKQEIFDLTNILNSTTTVEQYKALFAAKKKKLRDELVSIPTRIDELLRTMPVEIPNYKEVEEKITANNAELLRIDNAIEDKNTLFQAEYNKIQQLQKTKFELQNKLRGLQNESIQRQNQAKQDADGDIRLKESAISSVRSDIEIVQREISSKNNRINQLTSETDELRAKYDAVDKEQLTIDENALICPTCKQSLNPEKIENIKKELTENFNTDKLRKLNTLRENGQNNNSEIERLNKQVVERTNDLSQLQAKEQQFAIELQKLKNAPVETETVGVTISPEERELQIQIDAIIIPTEPVVDISGLKEEKNKIIADNDIQKGKLQIKTQVDQINTRTQELSKQERELSQQLADLEKSEFVVESYQRELMNTMESMVNHKFKYVRFKLFDKQVNGGESETCEATYKGVPFASLNTAGKILAGIDIINALCIHYGVTAPIFLDNRESITNIPDTDSQIINLIVSPEDNVLRISAVVTQVGAAAVA